jgi:hypothetical protein
MVKLLAGERDFSLLESVHIGSGASSAVHVIGAGSEEAGA